MGLFIGAALATVWQPATTMPKLGSLAAWTLNAAGALIFVALLALFHRMDSAASGPLLVGFPLCATLTTALIVVATCSESIVSKLLAKAPMRWVGERSYGVYLWHWPIFQATRPGIDLPLDGLPSFVVRVVLTVAMAEFSYRLVELPIRKGALKKLYTRICTSRPHVLRRIMAGALTGILIIGSTEVVLANRAITAYNASLQVAVVPLEVPPGDVMPPPTDIKPSLAEVTRPPADFVRPHADVRPRPADVKPPLATPTPIVKGSRPGAAPRVTVGKRIAVRDTRNAALVRPAMLVGDSVMLGASNFIKRRLNVVQTDAIVGRQAITTRRVIKEHVDNGTSQPTMIVDLGNNGTVDEVTLRGILTQLKDAERVVIVNANVPRSWRDNNDAIMARVVPEYKNAVLADWRAMSTGQPFFGPDGVHPNVAGARAYARIIAAAIETKAASDSRAKLDHLKNLKPTEGKRLKNASP
jgi:hypothetical protein